MKESCVLQKKTTEKLSFYISQYRINLFIVVFLYKNKKSIYWNKYTLPYIKNKYMSEILWSWFNILKKTTDALQEMNKENQIKTTEIITAPETELFINYLNKTYNDEEIKKAIQTTPKNYIQNNIRSKEEDVIDKVVIFSEIIAPKLELKELKEKIKPMNTQLKDMKNIISHLDEDKNQIKEIIDEYIQIDQEKRSEWLEQRGIKKTETWETTIQTETKPWEITQWANSIVEKIDPKITHEELNGYTQEYKNLPNLQELSPEKKWKEVYKYLRTLGYQDVQAAAIVGNIKIESNFDLNAVWDHGTAHGICQRRAARLENLKKFAKTKWKDWNDIYLQLDFMKQESSWRTAWYESKFLAAKTVKEATEIFDKRYERSDGKSLAARIQWASFYEKNMNIV